MRAPGDVPFGTFQFDEKLRRYYKNTKDIFKEDTLFMPIFIGGNHYILVVIHMQLKKLICYDSMVNNFGRARNELCVHNVKKFLNHEYQIFFNTT